MARIRRKLCSANDRIVDQIRCWKKERRSQAASLFEFSGGIEPPEESM
jgi:hypothetical protein